MAGTYDFELGKAAHVIIVEKCRVRKGETIHITIDSRSISKLRKK